MRMVLKVSLLYVFSLLVIVFQAAAADMTDIHSKPLHIGVVLSIGGLGDHAFNDAVYAGIQKLRKNENCIVDVIEPGNVTAISSALEFLAGRRCDLVVAVGIFANEAMRKAASEYRHIRFALLDSVVEEPNVMSILFDEEEGSFYAGALAGLLTKTGKIGFVGGMKSKHIESFERGFRNGIAFVNPQAKLIVQYIGNGPEAFDNPEAAKKLGLALAADGADIIYHAAGKSGLGVIEAARRAPFLVIGVDGDQSVIAPGKVAASMVKRLDIGLEAAVKAVKEMRFTGKILTLGLEEKGVELVISRFNEKMIDASTKQKLQDVELFLLHKVSASGSASASSVVSR